MMFCSHCGSELPEGSAFCGYCGKPLPSRSQPVPEQSGSAAAGAGTAAGAAATRPTERVASNGAQPGGSQHAGSASPATGAPSAQVPWVDQNPPKKRFYVTRGMTVGILVVVVAVVAFAVLSLSGVFGGSTQSSPEGVANQVETLFNDLFESDFDEDAFTEFGGGLIDLFPSEIVDDALALEGVTREELAEELGNSMGSVIGTYGSTVTSYLDFLSLDVDITLGDQLDSEDLEDLSESFSDAGYDYTVTDGYELVCAVTITLTEDYAGYSAGETISQELDTGFYTVEINGSWYLWGY